MIKFIIVVVLEQIILKRKRIGFLPILIMTRTAIFLSTYDNIYKSSKVTKMIIQNNNIININNKQQQLQNWVIIMPYRIYDALQLQALSLVIIVRVSAAYHKDNKRKINTGRKRVMCR